MGSYPISLRRQGNYYLAGSKSAYPLDFLIWIILLRLSSRPVSPIAKQTVGL